MAAPLLVVPNLHVIQRENAQVANQMYRVTNVTSVRQEHQTFKRVTHRDVVVVST